LVLKVKKYPPIDRLQMKAVFTKEIGGVRDCLVQHRKDEERRFKINLLYTLLISNFKM